MNNKRFLLMILGDSTGIDNDLNFIADSEFGVNYVDGTGMFICTFYSPFKLEEIHQALVHRPAMMLFDITDTETYGINLPTKYFLGLFPDIQKTLDNIQGDLINPPKKKVTRKRKPKVKEAEIKSEVKAVIEEYYSVDEILDKLSRNNYDRSCLTKKELEILSTH